MDLFCQDLKNSLQELKVGPLLTPVAFDALIEILPKLERIKLSELGTKNWLTLYLVCWERCGQVQTSTLSLQL